MNRGKIVKRIVLYVFGLFFLSLGVSISIQAGLGVSPVSSLAYGVTLTTGLSVGFTTVIANVLFIVIQAILNKRIEINEFSAQFIVAFLFGFFMNATLYIVQLAPAPETIFARSAFLFVSLFVVAAGLTGYTTAKLPLMTYDALTYAISERFKLKISKAKIIGDLTNVFVAGAICLIFIQTLGSIGIGTLAAAYFIGKILGWMIKNYQQTLEQWAFETEEQDFSESA